MGLFELLQKIVEVIENLGISYLVTGAVAAMAYGEPRLTNDIDVVADIDEGKIKKLLAAFLSDEFYVNLTYHDVMRHSECIQSRFPRAAEGSENRC